ALNYFFLSSRRRHTRSKRDWSSDVCSSDLAAVSHASGCVHQKAHSQQVSAPHILLLIPLASETHRALHLFDHPARFSRRALCTSVEDVIEGTAVEIIVDPVLEPDEECFDDFTEVCLEFAVALAVVIEFEI